MRQSYGAELEKRFTDPELRGKVLQLYTNIEMASDIVAALSKAFDDVLRMEAGPWAEKMAEEISAASDFFQRLELSMLEERRFLAGWARKSRWSEEDAMGVAAEPESVAVPEAKAPEPEPPQSSNALHKMKNLFSKE